MLFLKAIKPFLATASKENDVEITISYPGGKYILEKKVGAGQTVIVSINDLQTAGIIPASAQVYNSPQKLDR